MRFPRTRYDRGPDVRLLSAVAFIALLVLRPDGTALRAQCQPALPVRFDSYVKAHVKLTSDQHRQLLAGQPVMLDNGVEVRVLVATVDDR